MFASGSPFAGSLGGLTVSSPIVGAAAYGNAYALINVDRDVFNFSAQPFFGWDESNPDAPTDRLG